MDHGQWIIDNAYLYKTRWTGILRFSVVEEIKCGRSVIKLLRCLTQILRVVSRKVRGVAGLDRSLVSDL